MGKSDLDSEPPGSSRRKSTLYRADGKNGFNPYKGQNLREPQELPRYPLLPCQIRVRLVDVAARCGMKKCPWWEPRVRAIGHGPIGHGIADKPARSRRFPEYPKGHCQWPTRALLRVTDLPQPIKSNLEGRAKSPWREPRVRAIGHGPIGHGITPQTGTKPAFSRIS
jgi:hypothetical protein